MESLAEKFHLLFMGLEESHGTFLITGQKESGKMEGKAMTLREPVTNLLWEKHLSGEKSLGVVPINRDSKAKWGCIDVDEYPLDHADLIARIKNANLPLNVFRSKSGGAHLILILTDFIPAAKMVNVLKSWCALLKLGKVEVFPKQTKVAPDGGHVGNWLNMPYFGGNSRFLLDVDATDVRISDFCDKVLVVNPSHAKEHKLSLDESPIKDGPPCLQTLSLAGFPEGSRNNGLFALGVYCKRAYPDHWKQKLSEFNKELFKPPLDLAEVKTIASQLEKTDYRYRCHDQPINMYCNANVCRGRKHGIGDGALPIFRGVTKYINQGGDNEWFLEIDDNILLNVTAEELNVKNKFAAKLMNTADIMLPPVKDAQWRAFVQAILDAGKDKPVVMPFSDTVSGIFCDHVRSFIMRRANSDKSLIKTGKAWIDVKRGLAVFRLKDLIMYLARNKFERWTDGKVARELKDRMGAEIIQPRNEDGGRDFMYAVHLNDIGMSDWTEPKKTEGEVL